jgi:hypothetical protein
MIRQGDEAQTEAGKGVGPSAVSPSSFRTFLPSCGPA